MTKTVIAHNTKLTSATLSLLSQLIGIMQLYVLLAKIGSGRASDIYFYLFTMGLIIPQIFLDGFISPALLGKRISFAKAKKLVSRSLIMILIINVLIFVKIHSQTDDYFAYLIVIILFLNSIIQFINWFLVSINSLLGKPNLKSGMFIPANLLGMLLILIPTSNSYQSVFYMSIGLSLGNACFFVFIKSKTLKLGDIDIVTHNRPTLDYYLLLVKSSIAYLGIFGIQSLAFDLKTSALTTLTIPAKIVSGFTTIFINSGLPLHVNIFTFNEIKTRKIIWKYVFFSISICLLTSGFCYFLVPKYSEIANITAIWLISSVGSSFAQAILLKNHSPKAALLSTIPVISVFFSLSLVLGYKQFSVELFFWAFALIDSLSASIQFLQVRYWNLAIFFTINSIFILAMTVLTIL